MEGAAKETVIIVHGTWAAPEPGKRRWYQPVTSVAAAQPLFTAKLDAALQERGSPARCWAHCSQGDQTFQWSGANSWIARTREASALGDYVAKLQKEGWNCHIVAHSHGGNTVVEAPAENHDRSPYERAAWQNSDIGHPIHRYDVADSKTGEAAREDSRDRFLDPFWGFATVLRYKHW